MPGRKTANKMKEAFSNYYFWNKCELDTFLYSGQTARGRESSTLHMRIQDVHIRSVCEIPDGSFLNGCRRSKLLQICLTFVVLLRCVLKQVETYQPTQRPPPFDLLLRSFTSTMSATTSCHIPASDALCSTASALLYYWSEHTWLLLRGRSIYIYGSGATLPAMSGSRRTAEASESARTTTYRYAERGRSRISGRISMLRRLVGRNQLCLQQSKATKTRHNASYAMVEYVKRLPPRNQTSQQR